MSETVTPRSDHLRHALHLEYVTVGWNVVEGLVAVAAALAAGSIALLGWVQILAIRKESCSFGTSGILQLQGHHRRQWDWSGAS